MREVLRRERVGCCGGLLGCNGGGKLRKVIGWGGGVLCGVKFWVGLGFGAREGGRGEGKKYILSTMCLPILAKFPYQSSRNINL